MTGSSARNLLTDVPGVRVGHADDPVLASGVTVVLFDEPVAASVAIHGGAPGVRDTALLEPDMTVEGVDALVLSGGSAFGLDAMGGVQAALASAGRGFAVGAARVPIVPGAVLFDLNNGGDKGWGRRPPYWDLGHAAAEAAGTGFALGSVGAGLGATTVNLKGGIGSASAVTSGGFIVGAIAAANALGQATIGDGPHFWAAAYEHGDEFGGLGFPHPWPGEAARLRTKLDALPRPDVTTATTLAVVATDAILTKAQCKRLAIVAQGGLTLAIRPAHAILDGDTLFSAATGRSGQVPGLRDLVEIGALATDCVARAIARGVFAAAALPFDGTVPAWGDRFRSTGPAVR